MNVTARPGLPDLDRRYPLVIVGGGITGAGVLHEAARAGIRALLVEQGDFASGTSSWSSKLVHGGLRYLARGQLRLTLESVRERQRLLRERPGLIEPLSFMMPLYRGNRPGRRAMRTALAIYDWMAGTRSARSLDAAQALSAQPQIRERDLTGAVCYQDARTDDARLVLRLIQEARQRGASALNYCRAETLCQVRGRTVGVTLRDPDSGTAREVLADVVVDATGAWAGRLGGPAPRLRPLRGSHLLFSQYALPLRQAVSWLHPRDRRPVFAYPWEGAVLYGTTDVDHDASDPGAAWPGTEELCYLLEGLSFQFPSLSLDLDRALSVYSGVRPVVAGGAVDPSAESRESALWSAPGLVGVTGGKLTTFRLTARRVLRAAARQCRSLPALPAAAPAAAAGDRLSARYGEEFSAWHAGCDARLRAPIVGTPYCWAELRWAAAHEDIRHLDDLLLRRTRLGLLQPKGAAALLEQLELAVLPALGWDAARWQGEVDRYLLWWRALHDPQRKR